jgi:hypothetical protein
MFLLKKLRRMHFFSVNCVFRAKYQPLVLGFYFFPTKGLYSILEVSLMEFRKFIGELYNLEIIRHILAFGC